MARDLQRQWDNLLASEGLAPLQPNNARESHAPWVDARQQSTHYQACDAYLLDSLDSLPWDSWSLLALYSDARTGREAARAAVVDDSNVHKRLSPLIAAAVARYSPSDSEA